MPGGINTCCSAEPFSLFRRNFHIDRFYNRPVFSTIQFIFRNCHNDSVPFFIFMISEYAISGIFSPWKIRTVAIPHPNHLRNPLRLVEKKKSVSKASGAYRFQYFHITGPDRIHKGPRLIRHMDGKILLSRRRIENASENVPFKADRNVRPEISIHK